MLSWISGSSAIKDNGQKPVIDLPPVQVYSVETAAGKRPRTVKHLLRLNHVNNAILYNPVLQFHNHTPHILSSSYILGATPDQLNHVYDKQLRTMEPWRDSPGEISKHDWRDFLSKRNYQRAYVDFFEDQLVEFGYDWKQLLNEYMFGGKEPLINNAIADAGHPLIHLAYAYEMNSRTLAIEALTMSATCYDSFEKYINDPSYTKAASFTSKSPLEILHKIHDDSRLDGLFSKPGFENIEKLLGSNEDLVVDYWNAWDITDPKKQFEDSQRTAAAVVIASHDKDQYDFFLVHLLTTSHAVRILLPLVPVQFQMSLVRQWWLATIAFYISQLRPSIVESRIENHDIKGKDWKYVTHMALEAKYATDEHYVKALRALKESAETWGDRSNYFLKAAVKLADEFDDWGGF